MIALRFHCKEKDDSDGVVKTARQILYDAPHSKEIFMGKHTEGISTSKCKAAEELEKSEFMRMILKDNRVGHDYKIDRKTTKTPKAKSKIKLQ